MILFKVDFMSLTIKKVNGDPLGHDEDGDIVSAVEHHEKMESALTHLRMSAYNRVRISLKNLNDAKIKLDEESKILGETIAAADAALKFIEENRNDRSEG